MGDRTWKARSIFARKCVLLSPNGPRAPGKNNRPLNQVLVNSSFVTRVGNVSCIRASSLTGPSRLQTSDIK